ncbi:hypothetical protein LJC58_04640 [Lachnospiraceae bacterium OttesenSCG-928-D06]|nr:hypothetical protein [Lachnospiraceae bacterium OttesenSCG-928-D06]
MMIPKLKEEHRESSQQRFQEESSSFASALEKARNGQKSVSNENSLYCKTNTYGSDLQHHFFHYQSKEYSY